MSQESGKSQPVPAIGFGPNAGGKFSQENYYHPAAGWGAANSVTRVLIKQGELIDGARVVLRMVASTVPAAPGRTIGTACISTFARMGSSTPPGR